MVKTKRERNEEQSNPYSGVERQLLNTFFSGLYISAKDFLNLGRKMGFDGLALKSRELLIKEIIARSEKEGRTGEFSQNIVIIIDERIAQYSKLVENYPRSLSQISQLIQKANATKRVLATMGTNSIYG